MIPEDVELSITTAPKKNSKSWARSAVTWEQILGWMETPADHKEAGSYVLGTLTGTRRSKSTVRTRSGLTLDIDSPVADFLDDTATALDGVEWLAHTTFKATPDTPRYRLIVPLSREVTPSEYVMLCETVIAAIGETNFDSTTTQPERYMFMPSESAPGNFRSIRPDLPGELLDVEDWLGRWEGDIENLPTPTVSRSKRNPLEIPGTVGYFNTAYQDWDELIEAFELPYDRVGADRYAYTGASGAAGMGPVRGNDALVFSHHSHDPAYGKTCSAFDLVRIHRFGDLDENASDATPINRLPSTEAMLELASQDERVLEASLGDDFTAELEEIEDVVDPTAWTKRLTRNRRTFEVEDRVGNWDLIVENAPVFAGLYFNELTLSVESDIDLPWRAVDDRSRTFTGMDTSSLLFHLEREYGLRTAKQTVDIAVADAVQARRRNPIREYLEGLKWDGVPRVEESLPGVRPTDYTRLVARKSLVAAAARMLQPGIKWDHMLIIYGTEGLGKSYWIDRLARGWSASLGKIGDKDTLLSMMRSWIMVSDEGHSMKKADFDQLKEFVTQRSDVMRLPYDREAREYQRHSVIWGTTNDQQMLRRQEGNRRFLIVTAEDRVDFDALTDEYIDQLWAEAVHLFRAGEKLYLTDAESRLAAGQREDFMQEDPLLGMIEEYLDTPVPKDWERMSPDDRAMFIMETRAGMGAKGTEAIEYVSSIQVWREALGRAVGDHRPADLMRITDTLRDLPGWVRLPGSKRMPGYGQQYVYQRVDPARKAEIANDISELIGDFDD